jgi:hypothetical protein
MAQAMLRAHNFQARRSIGVQTGQNDEMVFYLSNKKSIKLYYSQVYKERVLSFNISTSKSFIMNKTMWLQFCKLLKTINSYIYNDGSDGT